MHRNRFVSASLSASLCVCVCGCMCAEQQLKTILSRNHQLLHENNLID